MLFRRDIEKDKLRQLARQGYPVTRTPYVPPIMASVAGTKILKGPDAMLKIFFAKEGTDLVKTKSLEFIRQYLMTYFKQYSAIYKGLKESPLPCNTIAVTFTRNNFDVGDACTEFIPTEGKWKSGYFTYQRLSENLQSTHLNLDGTQYLAGLCYYPVMHGMPKMIKLDGQLIMQAIRSVEIYPSEDRTWADMYKKHNVYGRYCETARKRVVVNFRDRKRGVCHQEIDYTKKNAYNFPKCEECAAEKRTYKYVWPGRVATVTPSIPKTQKPVPKKSAPKTKAPSDDAEMLSLLKSSKIGLQELKILISDAQMNAVAAKRTENTRPLSPVLIPQPSEFSYSSNDQIYASESYLDKKLEELEVMVHDLKMLQKDLHNPIMPDEEDQLISSKSTKLSESAITSESELIEEKLPESARLLRDVMSMQTGIAQPSEEVETVEDVLEANPAQDLSHFETLVPASDIPCEGPEEVCLFTPTKPLLETDPAQALSLLEESLKSVIAEDGTTCSDEDNTSLISTGSRLSSPALISQPSELSDYSEDFFNKNFENMEAVSDEIQTLQENLDFDSISDEDAEVISSASSTEKLMEDFEKVEKEITDVDSDIDVEKFVIISNPCNHIS